MINPKLIHPKSIAVIGGSDNPSSPGGKIIENLVNHKYQGKIYIVNPKKDKIKNFDVYNNVSLLPENIDLAIIAISAKYVEETVKILTEEKNTQAFIIISAGFSDTGATGKALEQRIVKQIEKYNGSLLGPNNIGLINTNYAGVFTSPVPKLDKNGVDLISGSGATAVFIMEAAMQQGLGFNSVWTVGNSAQIGVEEVLEYLDHNFTTDSPRIKLLYIEHIKNPVKFYKHAHSLSKKGAKIVAIKSGSSQSGQRAAGSHTGALATPDTAVQALFDKAGIIRVSGRNEMIQTAIVLKYGIPQGKNMLIVTHAGGPGVMLTDILEKNGMNVPEINHPLKNELLQKLYPGSSVDNPIDFLATGTAEQLDTILNYAEKFDEIDAIAVIFGSPGLFQVFDVYDVLDRHIKHNKKIIYPVLPSVINVKKEIDYFHQKNLASFPDEVLFGKALTKIYFAPKFSSVNQLNTYQPTNLSEANFINQEEINRLLKKYKFPLVRQQIFTNKEQAWKFAEDILPAVLKTEGILHKTEQNAVRLNILNKKDFCRNFDELQKISPTQKVLVQQQVEGEELFIGVKYEENFGHLLMFGVGGIFIEIFKDVQTLLMPVDENEIMEKLKKLKSYPLFQGTRNKKPIDIKKFTDLIKKTAQLIKENPEIIEMDFNPVIASGEEIYMVDIRIKKAR